MSYGITDTQNYTDIADAIRAKNGSADTYKPDEMAAAISNLPAPQTVTKGLVFSDYDSDGYPTKFEFVGFNGILPANYGRSVTFVITGANTFNKHFTSTSVCKNWNDITQIGNSCFQGIGYDGDFVLPSGLVSAGQNAVYLCNKIKSITFPTTITTIGRDCFAYNGNTLKTITFLGDVCDIPQGCFSNDNGITLYDFSNHTSNTIPSLYNTGSLGHASGCVIKVPNSLLATWQTTAVWQDLTNVTWQGV